MKVVLVVFRNDEGWVEAKVYKTGKSALRGIKSYGLGEIDEDQKEIVLSGDGKIELVSDKGAINEIEIETVTPK